MKDASLQQALSRVGAGSWLTASDRTDPNRRIRWLPIIDPGAKGPRVGLSEDGRWGINIDDVMSLANQSNMMPLLVLLEISPGDFKEALRRGLVAQGLDDEFWTSFPFVELVNWALGSDSDYWVAAATDWINMIPLNEQTRKIAQRLVRSKAISQGTRHKLQRTLARYK
jgi:hypothetical protein